MTKKASANELSKWCALLSNGSTRFLYKHNVYKHILTEIHSNLRINSAYLWDGK